MYFVDQPHLIFNIGEKGITVDHLASRAVAGSEIHRRMQDMESHPSLQLYDGKG